MVWFETEVVRARLNREAATQAVLFQLAAGSMLSKKAGKAFNAEIKKLIGKT